MSVPVLQRKSPASLRSGQVTTCRLCLMGDSKAIKAVSRIQCIGKLRMWVILFMGVNRNFNGSL